MGINQLIIASLKSEANEAELRELEAWRKASAENERHYQRFIELWKLVEGGDDVVVGPPPAVADIVGRDAAVGPEVVRLSPRSRTAPKALRSRTWRRRWITAAAAVMILAPAAWTLKTLLIRPQAAPLALGADEFVTGSSQIATVGLRDGSVVRLAPSSRLQLSGTAEDREIALRGRAYFAIAPDETRPFRIRAEAGSVTVLGTRFDLQGEGDDLRVIVVEGRVVLSAGGRQAVVGAGEVGRIVGATLVPTVRIPDIFTMIDWVGNFLAFQATPLGQVADEIERAYDVQVEITDDSLSERTVTGWFSDKTLDEVLRIVCTVAVARCTTEGDVVTIEPLPEGSALDTGRSSGLSEPSTTLPPGTSGGMLP